MHPTLINTADRATMLCVVLAIASLEDVALTLVGLATRPSAIELNPIAALALQHGAAAAVLLKILALAIAILAARKLAKAGHARLVKEALILWSALFLAVNAFSTIEIMGGF